jgi:hypothetical protein
MIYGASNGVSSNTTSLYQQLGDDPNEAQDRSSSCWWPSSTTRTP